MRNEGPVHLLVAEISAILRIYTDELLMMPFYFFIIFISPTGRVQEGWVVAYGTHLFS